MFTGHNFLHLSTNTHLWHQQHQGMDVSTSTLQAPLHTASVTADPCSWNLCNTYHILAYLAFLSEKFWHSALTLHFFFNTSKLTLLPMFCCNCFQVSVSQAPPNSWKGNAEANTLGCDHHPKRTAHNLQSLGHVASPLFNPGETTWGCVLGMEGRTQRRETATEKQQQEGIQGSADIRLSTGFTTVSG